MTAPKASKATYPPWPLIWEIVLAVAFAIMVAVGVVTVVLPELADPPAETAPRRAGATPVTHPATGPAGQAPASPTPPPP